MNLNVLQVKKRQKYIIIDKKKKIISSFSFISNSIIFNDLDDWVHKKKFDITRPTFLSQFYRFIHLIVNFFSFYLLLYNH